VFAVGAVFAASLVVTIAMHLMFNAYRIPSGAMSPAVDPGDRILARHINGHAAHRGDIVIFRAPTQRCSIDESTTKITCVDAGEGTRESRVIALGGDRIDTVDGRVRVNGVFAREPYLARGTVTDHLHPMVVPAGRVYLMGDNRPEASDSRVGGPVAVNRIVARVDYVNLPLDWIALGLAAASGWRSCACSWSQ